MKTERMSTRFGAIGKAALVAAAICAAATPLSSQADTGPLNGTPDDVRVAPLVTAHWNQGSVGNALCYNYYTPLNRVCGCTATALGQIMYYHRYPTERILPGETLYDTIDNYGSYSVSTNGNGGMTRSSDGLYTAFDPPYGGPYNWSIMVDSPTSATSENARKAIGLLTRDAGFAVFSHYFGAETSGYTAAVASSIILNLHYADAVRTTGFNANKLIANLEAGLPVEIGLTSHAVVADGYGYHGGKLYIHINYGYSGNKDGWYDPTTDVNGKSIQDMVANIFPPTRGARHSSVISGRVLDANGDPVANATVTASADGLSTVTTNSNANGIYAFILPAGDYTFSVSKSGAVGSRAYTVAASSQKTRAEGDGWGTGVNNSASGIDVTVYTESDFAKSWRNNAGDGRFDNAQNWSGGTLPASGQDVAVFVSGDTVITASSAMTVGTVSVPSGTVRFSGSGSAITLGGVNLLSAASTVEITGREGLSNTSIAGVGTLEINPGAGNTYTMPNNNTNFTGLAVVKSGTVKFGDSRSFGAQPSNIRVKGGATLDENNVSQGGYSGQKNYLTLEEGATLAASSGDVTTGSPLTKMTLEGNATIDATSGTVSIADGYDYLKMEIKLGANTLTKIGPKDFYISCCEISGTGLFDVTEGRVVMAPMYFTDNSPASCSEGTMRIRSGASIHVKDNNNKVMVLTVKDLILDGSVTKGTCNHVLNVTSSITGSGTTPMLTLGSDAVFKPTGTGYLTVTESLSGTFRLDMSGVDLSSTNEVPLVSVPSALAGSVSFDSTTIPAGWTMWPVPENGNVRYVLTNDDHFTERELFHTDLLGRFAKRAQDFDVGDYVQANLIAHYDGIRNAGADLSHDSTTRTWKNLVAGGPDATFVGEGGEWNAAGNGFVFDGSSVRADMDSPGIDMNHVNSTVQIACDVDYTQQSNGGGWYPGIFVMTDVDYGIFYNNTGGKSNVLNYKPVPYSNNDGGQRPTISPWGGKYVTAAFNGNRQYLVEGTSLGEGKPRSNTYDQPAKRFAWGGNPSASTRYVKGTYHSVRIYNATLTEDQLSLNRYIDEIRFRGAFTADDVDIVIATNVEGVEGAEPSGEYMVNGSHTFSAADVMLNGKSWILAGYTLENWNENSGTWTQIAESANTSFAFTNCLANGKMRLTWNFEEQSLQSAALAHRWSFNGEGTDYTDSITGTSASTFGSDATKRATTGGKLVLRGNGSGQGSLNLGKNLLGSGDATVEIWASNDAVKHYARVFDYGNGSYASNPGQTDCFMFIWSTGTDATKDIVQLKKNNTAVINKSGTMSVMEFGKQYYFAFTFKTNGDGSSTIKWMRRDAVTGALERYEEETVSDWTLANLVDKNSDFWLGVSKYSGDSDANASYDEVRIWNGALGEDQLAANASMGPDAIALGLEEGFSLAAGTTFNVPADGYTASGPVRLVAGSKLLFDTASLYGQSISFSAPSYEVPSGDILDYVELTDSANFTVALSGNTITVTRVRRNEPDEYLEYVESDGRQVVDTGVTPGPNTATPAVTSMKVDADLEWISGGYMLSSNWNDFHPLKNVGDKIGAAFKNSGGNVVNLASDKDLNSGRCRVMTTVVAGQPFTVDVDGVTTNSVGNNVVARGSGRTLYAFASNTGSTAGDGHSTAKLYGMKIYINGTLVGDFRPGVKDGVAGLYNCQKDTWHPSISGTPLIAGPVCTPASPTLTVFSVNPYAVTLTCATAGATIYYTTDGSDPTTSSTQYSAPFAVTGSTTVKARAYKTGLTESAIYSVTFTCVPPATLTHRWSFNGTTDAECLADSVGNATATKGGSSVTWNDGKAVVASTGSGTNKGYLDLGAGVLGSGDATLEIWYEKLENPGAWSSAFAYGRNGDNRFQINTAYGYNNESGGNTGSSRAPVTSRIGGTSYISGGSNDWNDKCLASLIPNLPQHISITFKRNGDGSTTVRWMSRDSVTGFLMKECSCTIPSWTLADASDFVLTLGRDTGSTYDLKANFHEVRTWNGVLSDEQLSANAFAGPDAPLGGRESAFSSGFDIAAGSTFTIGKEGMFRTSGPVGVGTGASIVFDTANFSGTEMKFVSAGFSLPAGASSVLDFVTLTDSDNYVASVDGGTITVVSAQPAYAKWISASAPTSAADLANAANWACYRQDGTTVVAGAVPGSLTTLIIDGTTSFSLPAGVTPTWGSVLVGGHAAPHYGRIASTGGDNNWITFRQRPNTDYTPCGEKAVSYLDRTSGNSPSDLGGSQLRFDGWIYASAEQAGRWDIRCAMDDMITFALDGEWQFLLNTWHYGITAGSYVSEGWHRFTLIVRDTGGGYGVSTALNGKNYPFVVSINGGAELGFSQLTFGADTAVTLADDCDWSALGEINLANGVVIDLNGHTLKLDDFTTDSFGAMVTNRAGTMSAMIFDKDPFSSSANVQGLLRGVGENITLVQDGARSATWTGGGNDGGAPANPANWEVKLGTLVIANAVPDDNTTVLMQGQNINMQLPYGTTLSCADFQIGNCTFTADCDWRGLSITPSISGEANLNGHNLYLGHLNAVGGSFVNNAADTTSRVLFDVPASGSYSEFSEQVFIDNIGNLSTGENVFLSLLKPDDENDTTTATLMLLGKSANVTAEFVQTNGTVNLGNNANKIGANSGNHGVYRMSGGTLTTGTGSELQVGSNGTGEFIQTGGAVTINNWGSIGRVAGTGTYTISGGTLTTTHTGRPIWIGGDNASGRGTLNISGTAVVTIGGGIDAGRSKSSHGYINLNGGTLNVRMGDGFNVGRDSSGTLVQNGGTLTANEGGTAGNKPNNVWRIAWGTGGTGSYTLNDGTAIAKSNIYIGDGGTATYVQNGGTMTAEIGATLAVGANSKTTFTLAGGVFNTKFFNKGSGTANITFNGGTVAALENTSTFFRGISSVNVGAGGMTFDTAGYNVEINSLGMTPAVGSSFVKAGSGTLTMDVLPPTDVVVASNGTFKVLAAASSASASADTLISVSRGGTLDITGVSLAPAFVSGAGTVQGGTLAATKELRAKLGDCLTVNGGTFNVEGAKVTFSVEDIASLATTRKTYTLVRAANGGTITGNLLQPATDAQLPKSWHVTATSSSVTLRKNGVTIHIR